jgi:hypothetical protein
MPTLSGSFAITGSINTTGNITFSATGSSVVQNVHHITPNGTASFDGFSNTTATLQYGINLITTATSTDYCAKLPQPFTGKSVTVINKSGIDIQIFPSNAGGDINGGADEGISVPSDGTSYLFNCYENPLPGGWSVLATSGNNIAYTSEVVSSSLSAWTSPFDPSFANSRHVFGFINNSMKATGSSPSSANSWYSLDDTSPIFIPQYEVKTLDFGNDFSVWPHQRPDNPWSKINGILLSTNLSSSIDELWFSVQLGMSLETYNAGTNIDADPFECYGAYGSPLPQWTNFKTNTLTPWVNSHPGNWGADISAGAGGMGILATPSVVPGTFTAGNDSPYLATNAGEPGTVRFILSFPQAYSVDSLGATNLGINYIGSHTTAYGSYDNYRVKHWGLTMGHFYNFSLPNLKLIPRYFVTAS